MIFSRAIPWFLLTAGCAGAGAGKVASDLEAIRGVGREGAGSDRAREASLRLSRLDGESLTDLLDAFTGAGPEARNYLRGIVDAVAERSLAEGKGLPAAALEAFALDRARDGRARRLAYDWLLRVDPAAESRILPGSLDDPAVELRRDAVEARFRAAEALLSRDHKDEARTELSKLFVHARDRDQVEKIAKRLESLGEKPDLTRHFGFLRKWRLIGPFDNSSQKGYAQVYPPEHGLDPTAEHDGKVGKVRWVEHETGDAYGQVDLNKELGKHMGAVAYAVGEFDVGQATLAEIRAGSSNAVKIWLNGELVFTRDEYHHGLNLDQYSAPVQLRQGRNTVLIKVCQNEGKQEWEQDWVFQMRVCDSTGGGIL